MVSLYMHDNEGDGAEQKFLKVHGSWLGWSGDMLTVRGLWGTASRVNCSKTFINIPFCTPSLTYLLYSHG
jgi:hypothetical protein